MKLEKIENLAVIRVRALLPEVVLRQMQRADERLVLAGGAIRDTLAGLPVKDLDIFCHSQEQAERLAQEVSGHGRLGFIGPKKTTFAYTVELPGQLPVQYVFYKDFSNPADLISQFDFRACGACIYFHPNQRFIGVALEGAGLDCAMRKLVFMSQLKDAGKLSALGRAVSLVAKGWTICTNELANIVTHFEPTLDVARVKRSFRPAYGRV